MISKIVCLGDSITKGKVWKENERRPYITQNSYPLLLNRMLGVDVLNDGICDITSGQVLQHIRSDISLDSGSVVIIEIGGNDCNPNWREIKKDPDGEHDAIVPLSGFKENLTRIIDIIKGYDSLPVLSTLPPLDGDKYYNLLKRVFGEEIKRWIDRNGGIYRWQERYSDLVKDTARNYGIELIDIRKAFLDTGDYRRYIGLDGIHPNEEGYSLIAKTCCSALKCIIGRNTAYNQLCAQ